MNPLNYCFKVEFKSCRTDRVEWVTRSGDLWRIPNTRHESPWAIAGEIAADQMSVNEQGVRVTFLGLQVAGQNEAAITPLSRFTLTLERIP